MGLFLSFKRNEGMHVELPSGYIDIIVRAVKGTKRYREVDLKIRGVPGLGHLV